mmetsp:Transcript_27786/g.31545  ORF Transcript_27786/g.31545 Transcript_27786/m.31545 type:complete len:242 (+) Transcript_27786:268-993(+)|eukprot:CAMPEP_0170915552 /NCGR_PEP_ID=MMETSP0735-20130129/6263_1 /TAXON_ID=186038 /ORGANISM="Fragilariopsis kerguelensis, Strain L26-C5" /LENGTH=241 /DNA_ID=CAMNT_0011313477 /DNA_START=235 /DNA_END=960 /DNA_ORIENTATION=+
MSGSELAPFVASILKDTTIVEMQKEIALLKDSMNKQLLLQVTGEDGSVTFERSLADLTHFTGKTSLHNHWDTFGFGGSDDRKYFARSIEVPFNSIAGLEIRIGANIVYKFASKININDNNSLKVMRGNVKHLPSDKSQIAITIGSGKSDQSPLYSIQAFVYMTNKEYLDFERIGTMDLMQFVKWCKKKNKKNNFNNFWKKKNKKNNNKINIHGITFYRSMIVGSLSLLQSITGNKPRIITY